MSLYLNNYNYHYDVIHLCTVVIIYILIMPIKVFGNSSHDNINKIAHHHLYKKLTHGQII